MHSLLIQLSIFIDYPEHPGETPFWSETVNAIQRALAPEFSVSFWGGEQYWKIPELGSIGMELLPNSLYDAFTEDELLQATWDLIIERLGFPPKKLPERLGPISVDAVWDFRWDSTLESRVTQIRWADLRIFDRSTIVEEI